MSAWLEELEAGKWAAIRDVYADFPAIAESEWQDRRAELIWREPSATCHAGDKWSTQRWFTMREVVTDDGRCLRMRWCDEFGRFYG